MTSPAAKATSSSAARRSATSSGDIRRQSSPASSGTASSSATPSCPSRRSSHHSSASSASPRSRSRAASPASARRSISAPRRGWSAAPHTSSAHAAGREGVAEGAEDRRPGAVHAAHRREVEHDRAAVRAALVEGARDRGRRGEGEVPLGPLAQDPLRRALERRLRRARAAPPRAGRSGRRAARRDTGPGRVEQVQSELLREGPADADAAHAVADGVERAARACRRRTAPAAPRGCRPATPLLAGRPMSCSHWPAKSYIPQVAITLSTLGTCCSSSARAPVIGLTPRLARVAPITARSRQVTRIEHWRK